MTRYPRTTTALSLALAALLGAGATALALRDPEAPATPPVAAAPSPSPSRSPSPSPSPSATPSEAPSVVPSEVRTSPRPRAVRPDPFALFRGLGAWIDVYDFEALDPVQAVGVMKANGVRTLYVQTGRYTLEEAVAPGVGAWLEAAHDAGLKAVGWYLPAYDDLERDVERAVAVARFRSGGERFDAVGVDIEVKTEVESRDVWNGRVVRHLREVRARIGRVPLGAITPNPLQMQVAPGRWAGFPWRGVAASSDALLLMSYWSFRTDCPSRPEHCAYGYTAGNVRQARALARRDLPVHVIGGVGDAVDAGEVADFARAALDVRADGASFYDFRTTASAYWPLLRKLRSLR